MRPVVPYLDENKQVIFVECEDQLYHDLINGALLAVSLAAVLTAAGVLLA